VLRQRQEALVATLERADDTPAIAVTIVGVLAAAWLPVGTGLGLDAVWTCVTMGSGCTREVSDEVIYTSLGVGLAGVVTTVVGAVWLAVNGAPWRRRDELRNRVRHLRRLAVTFGIDVRPEAAAFAIGGTF
jgi:hypothetical protein